MDKKVPLSEKKAKVNGILTKLGLATVKDSLCGFPGGLIRGNDLVMASGVCSPHPLKGPGAESLRSLSAIFL